MLHEKNQLANPLFKCRTDKTMGRYKFNQQQVLYENRQEPTKKILTN